jgi:hypothetical protein
MKSALKFIVVTSWATGIMLLSPLTASASLIYDASITLSAQGFGSAPRDLTVQATGNTTSPESGCVSVSGGTFSVGASACMVMDAAFMGNGLVNLGGDEPQPLGDTQKYGAPTESERGIVSAADIGILFNATEPGGDAINVTDLTLKFYLGNMLIGSIDGSQNFASSNPGNGVAGFVFRVDEAQQPYVQGLLNQGNVRFALESTLTGSSGGPETFRIVSLSTPQTVPDGGATLLLLSAALGALGSVRRFVQG